MKLFVDDIRDCPDGWVPARTVTDAIRILATQKVEEVSLDHDIVWCNHKPSRPLSPETFEGVAWYIAKMVPRPLVRIHTGNYPAGERMACILGIDYNPYAQEAKS